ncbi:PREDICTED: uncharacterized protein LOC105566563 isoform X1 [Vollenhovia emeryi]|uniref:uncharacterized protein LOC105566563 isoform X1 n=1 Tax=Vollenhovia emeryi TaxID=411798 RepID=UPI0005F399E3|nr:PREDICTED: uncharacterized protein LOC105566563 isoform X1 [Vollenhovia emeryi]
MITRHRVFLFHILCCVAAIHGILLDTNDAETCDLLCVQCNASAVFENGHCDCNFADSDKVSGAECIQRIQKEVEAVELNMLSEDLTDEERDVRSVSKYRRRLRPGDAEKVAQYFINGGPATGHSHFVRAFSAAGDSAGSAINSFSGVVDESNPEGGFHDAPLTSPVSSNTCDTPLYMVSESESHARHMQGAETYPPILRAMNPALTYPTSGLYDPMSPLVSLIHPQPLHPLIRAATLPTHILHRILHPRVYHPVYHHGIVRSPEFQPDTSDTASVGQPYKNDDDFTTSNLPIANANKLVEKHVEGTLPQYVASPPWYSPMQNQLFPYPCNCPFESPALTTSSPVNPYIVQLVPFSQDIWDPFFMSNSQSSYKNNVNTEQKSRALTTDKAVQFKEEVEKSDDKTRDNTPEEKTTEKNRADKL